MKVTTVLQIVRGGIFAILTALFSPLFIAIAIIEFVIAKWLWTQRLEAWGIAVGFSLFHFIFPLSLGASQVAFLAIVIATILELVLLTELQMRGYYNFNFLVKYDPSDEVQISGVQRMMFRLVLLAQSMKIVLLLVSAYLITGFETVYGTQLWYGFPQVTLIILFSIVEIIATAGFYLRRNWAFHLVLVTATLSFAETMIAWSFPIVLIGVWIITLLMPCWVKWVIYEGVLTKSKSKDTSLQHVEKLIEK